MGQTGRGERGPVHRPALNLPEVKVKRGLIIALLFLITLAGHFQQAEPVRAQVGTLEIYSDTLRMTTTVDSARYDTTRWSAVTIWAFGDDAWLRVSKRDSTDHNDWFKLPENGQVQFTGYPELRTVAYKAANDSGFLQLVGKRREPD
jgi:hypothetical protein